MTTKELEALTGFKPTAKMVFVLWGDRLFLNENGDWTEYPPYPCMAGLPSRVGRIISA
jgi:hypothetical protein